MKKAIRKVLYALMVLEILFSSGFGSKIAEAAEIKDAEYALLYVSGYEVTNETITPGSDFVLTVKITNYSARTSATNAVIYVGNPVGVVPEYGTVTTAYVEKIAPRSTKSVIFRYSANSDIAVTELNFSVGVRYDNAGDTVSQLRIPVGRMTDFAVEEYSVPERMSVGQTGYASALVENLCGTGVSNVVMVARCNGRDIASANIGTMSAKTYKTQNVGLTFTAEGEYPVDLLLTYTNSEGTNKEFVISSDIIKVVPAYEPADEQSGQEDSWQDNPQKQTENQGISRIVLLSISGVLLIGLCCIVLILLYRRK